MHTRIIKNLVLCLAIIFSSCSTISHFDKTAYEQITAVEADALSLMDRATAPYPSLEKDINKVKNDMQKAYLYDKNRPKNKITESM